MKALEELTADIREKLPRLMELTEGQRLLTLISDESNDIYEGEYERIGNGAYLLENGNIEIGGYEYEIGKDFEIVGKEPMLNDILQWIIALDLDNVTVDLSNQEFGIIKDNGLINRYDDDECEGVVWDLSKLYLKDQSPELIHFLHGLIKK